MKCLKTFDYRIEQTDYFPKRTAVRSIIMKNNSILMVFLKETNEYKFPGGGMEAGESYENTLIRETQEETGALIKSILECVGYVDQIYPDKYIKGATFSLRSIYYLCDVTDHFGKTNLSQSEMKLGFQPQWIDIHEAIEVNRNRMKNGSNHHWTERELFVLEYIRDYLLK